MSTADNIFFQPVHETVPLDLPPPGEGSKPSVLAFSMAKAGSTLLFEMLRTLSRMAGVAYFEPEAALFAAGRDPLARPTDLQFQYLPVGYCFGGYRQFPAHPIPLLDHARTVFLVRDPRDMIVSLYFSLMGSHEIPTRGADGHNAMQEARDFVARLSLSEFLWSGILQYTRMFEGYVANRFHARDNVRVYRYEDVIYRKAAFLQDVQAWFGWNIDPVLVDSVASSADSIPVTEQRGAHIRQVHPGNHAAYLSAAESQQICNDLREYMSLFGYA